MYVRMYVVVGEQNEYEYNFLKNSAVPPAHAWLEARETLSPSDETVWNKRRPREDVPGMTSV